ncbi:hypothetical protein [Paenibacillus chitinolyticus]|uniref:hypothetical protein n=1 Tax=Paenibacillus chitinolyticus TaxID=79263 RepID=UPI00362A6359
MTDNEISGEVSQEVTDVLRLYRALNSSFRVLKKEERNRSKSIRRNYDSKAGYQAAQLLVDLLEGRNVSHHIVLNTELVKRESVKRLPL